jgi:pyruvate formate-lyase/glycerol dehydratase family glycyl radical enzyme
MTETKKLKITEMTDLLDKFITIQPTERMKRLRANYIENSKRTEPIYTIYFDRAIAKSMKESEGEPMVLRRAKAFAAAVDAMPVEIFPDEPFVGWIGGSPITIPVGAEQRGARLEIELDYYKNISDEDRNIIREEIIPYWKGEGDWKRHWFYQNYQMLPPETRNLLYGDPDPNLKKIGIITRSKPPALPRVEIKEIPGKTDGLGRGLISDGMTRHHIGHCSYGYEKVLKKGFLGIKKDAENRLDRIDWSDTEEQKKVPFLKGVIIAMDAAAKVGKRFAASARDSAQKEENIMRKAELEKIVEICERVPAHPARTFHEALQSVWFTQILNWCETPILFAVSPGKVDQYLYPYFEKDTREGYLTKEEAQELIDCWLMRFTQGVSPFIPMAGSAYHMDVGGFKEDGSDATNELSFMFIEGMIHTRMVEPNFGVLVHSKTPEEFLLKACQLCVLGTGHPMFLNNDIFVENFLSRGTLGGPPVPLSLARTSGAIGCNEPHVANYDSEFNVGPFLILPHVLELTLFDGWSWNHEKYMGVRIGDPRKFKSFSDFQEAYLKQLSYLVTHCEITNNNSEITLAQRYPTVYASALIEDCIENGRTREEGGARFNFGPCIATAGATDVGDSLAAIKKLIYDEKEITMSELLDALEKNFEGYKSLRQKLLQVPKFGNDNDYVDEIVAWVMKTYSDEVIKHKNTRGGHLVPYQNPLVWYVSTGRLVGALPSGRKAREPLSDGISPTRGVDVNGPTAVFNSVGKIDNTSIFFGQTLNMRLNKEIFATDIGVHRLATIIRSFVDLKIHHCQFNLISSETLREAQRNPHEYQDLTVRVAGYVAYFTRLSKEVQDSIIARTEHNA